MSIMTGTMLIIAERQRQIDKEGWTSEHDAKHAPDDLAVAGACYALPVALRGSTIVLEDEPSVSERGYPRRVSVPSYWRWWGKWWKPTPHDRVRELVKAGALIAAEIDRLLAEQARTANLVDKEGPE
mgnify:CR=1 FL=1